MRLGAHQQIPMRRSCSSAMLDRRACTMLTALSSSAEANDQSKRDRADRRLMALQTWPGGRPGRGLVHGTSPA